jgi:3,4-dihydroxy 2-butanone 4-phosphate synthase / GTP cyclohydrolase II
MPKPLSGPRPGAPPDGPWDDVDEALRALRQGRCVLVVDDEDREDEGDLVLAAELAEPASMAFLIRHSSGIVCVGVTPERAAELRLPPMVAQGDDPRGTAFTVSVDLRDGTTTGVSAADRAHTVRALADPATRPSDLTRPGHVFPLRARPGGVLQRAGHTEDDREYGVDAQILSALGVREVSLMTNNPAKYRGLAGHGVRIADRGPLLVAPNPDNIHYLTTKRVRLDHALGGSEVS